MKISRANMKKTEKRLWRISLKKGESERRREAYENNLNEKVSK